MSTVEITPQSVQKPGLFSDAFLDGLERNLDNRFKVPFLNARIGLDGIIGLVPGIGDTLTAALSGLIILDGWKRGVRKRTLLRMAGNAGLDTIIGSVPLVGDIFDFAFKSNVKNIKLMKQDLSAQAQR